MSRDRIATYDRRTVLTYQTQERRADRDHRHMEIAFWVHCLLGYGVTKSVVGYYELVRACCLCLQVGRS